MSTEEFRSTLKGILDPDSLYAALDRDVVDKITPYIIQFMPNENAKKKMAMMLKKNLAGLTRTTIRNVLAK